MQAVFGDETDAEADRIGGAPDVDGPLANPDLPGVDRVCAEDRARELRPPGADQTRERQDLALVEPEVDVAQSASPAEALHPQDLARRGGGLGQRGQLEVASDHHGDQSGHRHVGNIGRRDLPAVTQHRHPVADLRDLLEPVRDVDDRPAFGLQRAR